MSRFQQLIHEIHRRSLWQVTALFVGISWAVLQVIDLFIERGLVPEWTFSSALLLLLIGLPIVLSTAFVQEGGPAGSPGDRGGGPSSPARRSPDSDRVHREAAPAPTAAARAVEGGRVRRYLTWRNAILGGVGAFALLGIGTAGYMISRSLGIGPFGTLMAKGVLEAREPIIVADFGSPADDSLLAGTVTDALRIDLSQSPVVKILSEESLAEGLWRMGRNPGSRLDEAAAREVALREGVGAIVVGEVSRVGPGYVLSARLRSVEGGETLVPVRETAADSTRLIPAIGELSKALRERIGESLRSIRRSPPLERVTTSSLQALRRYSQALRAYQTEGAESKAQLLLEEAIALDSAFAMAHRKLGVILGNQDRDPARRAAALRSAFAHRERLTERERYMTMATYYSFVGEDQKAAAAYESLLLLEPDDPGALNNLASLRMDFGEYEEARELLDRALVADDSSGASQWINLINVSAMLGKWGEAESILAAARRRLPENRVLSRTGIELAAGRADYELAIERTLRHGQEFGAEARSTVEYNLGNLEAARGRLSEAERHKRASSALALSLDREPFWAFQDLLDIAEADNYIRALPRRGLVRIDSVLARFPLVEFPVENRSYLRLAQLYADAGRPDRARDLLAEYERVVPEETQQSERERFEWTSAVVAVAEGRADEAIPVLRRLADEPGPGSYWSNLRLGDAYDRAGEADSARAAYTRYIEVGDLNRYYADWLYRAPVLERLAELHDAAGNVDEAIRHYAMFIEQWAGADPELQPRVRRARTRLEKLVAGRG